MSYNLIRSIFFALLCLIPVTDLKAQTRVSAYADIGQTQVSDGLYIKTAGLARYQFGKNAIEAGVQIDLKSNNENVFSGYSINASRQLLIKNFPLEIRGFWVRTAFSDELHETNWGMLLGIQRNHFAMRIGTNFRCYAFTKNAIEDYGFDENTKFRENLNLMYSFSYYLKPIDNYWNIALSMTNIDYFIINQETNPVFNLAAHYKLNPALDLFAESWYKSAGAFNLSVNYFGFFFRKGIVWCIN